MDLSVTQALSLLERWREEGLLRALDLAFARFVADAAGPASPGQGWVVLLAGLTAHLEARGHTCLSLHDLAADPAAVLEGELPLVSAWQAEVDHLLPSTAGHHTARLAPWLDALARYPAVDAGPQAHSATPLVLAGHRLFLRRYWRLEQAVARRLAERVQMRFSVDEDRARGTLDRLFTSSGGEQGIDWQKVACAVALRAGLTVITGGPGTGKTYTVARLLALLDEQVAPGEQPPRVLLAAPTGKAAARLRQSIEQALQRLSPDLAQRTGQAMTLHALLGVQPGTRRFRHHAGHPLNLDVLVVDEASMVHLDMMASLLDAMPPGARLILLGDKDQLASVEAGAVLGDLSREAAGGGFDADAVAFVQRVAGQTVPEGPAEEGRARALVPAGRADGAIPPMEAPRRKDRKPRAPEPPVQGDLFATTAVQDVPETQDTPPSPAPPPPPPPSPSPSPSLLGPQSVQLRQSRRFGGLIGQLAQAVNEGRGADALALMPASAGQPVLAMVPASPARAVEAALEGRPGAPGYAACLALVRQGPGRGADEQGWLAWVHAVLDAFDACRLLAAVREGPWGVQALNDAVERALSQQGLLRRSGEWYEGRPVMATRNDPGLGVFNGDVGMVLRWPWDRGRDEPVLKAFFRDGAHLRPVLASRLSDVETAFAMTVHKSQGSEFTHTVLALPPEAGSSLLTRELVYTGITRAREALTVVAADAAALTSAIARPTRRHGGLADALAAAAGGHTSNA